MRLLCNQLCVLPGVGELVRNHARAALDSLLVPPPGEARVGLACVTLMMLVFCLVLAAAREPCLVVDWRVLSVAGIVPIWIGLACGRQMIAAHAP